MLFNSESEEPSFKRNKVSVEYRSGVRLGNGIASKRMHASNWIIENNLSTSIELRRDSTVLLNHII